MPSRCALTLSRPAPVDALRYGLLYRRASRYPVSDRQIAPTALGNGIRRFETYAADRYKLDSQLLWHHLQAAAPDRVVQAVDNARTNVDFFVCLLYGMATTGLIAAGTLLSGAPGRASLFSALVLGVGASGASYRLALYATDEWEAAVRAMVDHGRLGVAKAFGLNVPQHLADERTMWRAVNRLVRRPYSEKPEEVETALDKLRSGPSEKARKKRDETAADPAGLSD